jgi:hypothetical protein
MLEGVARSLQIRRYEVLVAVWVTGHRLQQSVQPRTKPADVLYLVPVSAQGVVGHDHAARVIGVRQVR